VLICGCTPVGSGGVAGGDVITEEKYFTDFDRVEVEGAYEVTVTQSDSFSIIISADADLFDYIAVSKRGDTLRIYLDPRHIFTDFTLQAETLRAEITMPALYGLELSGACKGTITGFQSSETFHLEVSGASSLDMNNVQSGDADFEVSGASAVTGNVTADDMEFDVSGTSKIELAGLANDITFVISGASNVNLSAFPFDDADIQLSGASQATVNLKGRLDAALSGASSLYFQGNPAMGDITVSGASTVKHK